MGSDANTKAAAYATRDVPTMTSTATAEEARARLTGKERFESAADLAVIDDGALVGLARIEDVLAAPDDTLVVALMDPDPPVIAADMNQRAAAWKAVSTARAPSRWSTIGGGSSAWCPRGRCSGYCCARTTPTLRGSAATFTKPKLPGRR